MNGISVMKVLEKVKHLDKNFNFGKWTCKKERTMETLTTDYYQAKPFDSIPGPKSLPLPFGEIWKLTYGQHDCINYLELHNKLNREYGPMVKLSRLIPVKYVLLYDPNLVETLYRNESVWPRRDGFDMIEYYLKHAKKDTLALSGGIIFKNGQEWYDKRSAVNKTMLQPKSAQKYVEPIDQVTAEFVDFIKCIRLPNQEVPENFFKEVQKWALECVGMVALDSRLGCLKNDKIPDPDIYKLIKAVENLIHTTYALNIYPFVWKYVSTPTWRVFVNCLDVLSEIFERYIIAKMKETKIDSKGEFYEPKSVLESFLLYKKDEPMVAVTMIMDMFIAGIDTTSHAASSAIYHIANNPEKQEILHRELKTLLPSKNSPVTWEILQEFKYLKACIKESMRISPVLPYTIRTTTKDIVLGDYQIPSGTYITNVGIVMCHSEEIFKHAKKFLPERWLKSESNTEISAKNAHPFASLPYGFGPRACLGRRFAEVELETLIAKLFRNFKLEYNHGEMTFTKKFFYVCGKPLKFKMEDRLN